MDKCIICGRDIDESTHYKIQSRGVEIDFFSRDCVNQYVKNAEQLLNSHSNLQVRNLNEEKNSEFPDVNGKNFRIYSTIRLEK